MSKIICDICGTAYPETAAQCPICGSAKQIDSKTVSDSAADGAARPAKATTKGGHFSNANVRKRNKASQAVKKTPVKKRAEQHTEQQENNKSGMVVAAWLLLIAVLLVLVYIVVQFVVPMFGQSGSAQQKDDTTTSAADSTTLADAVPVETGVPCTGLTVTGGDITLDAVGREWLITVTAEPVDTTDVITYASADESVATVSAQGRVTAVGPGETVITITCGNVTQQCKVICGFGEETTEPETTEPPTTEAPATEEPTTEEPTTADTTEEPTTEESTETTPPETTEATEPPQENFGLLKQDDVTLAFKGETFEFETDGAYLSEITWTSDDPAIATVENGKVTGVGTGKTVIRAEYNGRTDSCIIRCAFDDGTTKPDEEESEDHPEWPHLYPSGDVSIAVGENFALTYVNADGECPDMNWQSDDTSVAVVDGDWVTGVAYGVATITGTCDGIEITCIVRVIL